MNVLRGKNHLARFQVNSIDGFFHRAQLCHAIHVLVFRGNEPVYIHDIYEPQHEILSL